MGEIEQAIQSKDPRGTRPYSPAMMVALLLYAYCVGVYSSRKIAEELRRREERLRRIRQAKAELEAEARASRAAELREQAERARERAEEELRDKQRKANETRARRCDEQAEALEGPAGREEFRTDQGLPKHRVQARPDGTPHPKAQRNFVDPDSRIMESGGSFLQGYNCQAAGDEDHQVIVAHAVTDQCPDNGNLLPLLDQIEPLCKHGPKVVTADAGYWSPHADHEAARRGTELYVAPDRQRHGADPAPLEAASDDEEPTAKDRMRKKLQTQEGREIYARRKVVVEPVYGQIKEAHHFRRFLLRGLHAAGGQWAFLCTAHNVLKLYRASLGPRLRGPADPRSPVLRRLKPRYRLLHPPPPPSHPSPPSATPTGAHATSASTRPPSPQPGRRRPQCSTRS